jgi:hypothetical protein
MTETHNPKKKKKKKHVVAPYPHVYMEKIKIKNEKIIQQSHISALAVLPYLWCCLQG